jgi:glycosyltransferase involved in cell wall biosynthesis
MNSPNISIITPVFNNIKYIEQCIQNVIRQNCQEIEHLIIDGGSSDGTAEFIQQATFQHSHIRFISEPDSGQSNAMNKGIRMAAGEYIGFLNVDDYYEPEALNEVIKILHNYPSEFIVGNCNVWLPNNVLQYVNKPSKLKPYHLLSGFYLPVNPSAYFYKKSIHQLAGFYNESNHFNMDIEFLIQASLITKIHYVNRTFGNFRLLENTKTVSDLEAGSLEIRKNELYSKFIERANLRIRILTQIVKIQRKSHRKLLKIKKKIFLPFNMVYYKLIKLLNA